MIQEFNHFIYDKGTRIHMKTRRLLISVLLLALASASLAGCKHNTSNAFGEADKSIYLFRDLCIEDIVLSDFDMSKYDAKEFSGFLEEDLEKYNASHPFVKPEEVELLEGETTFEPEVTKPIAIMKCAADKNVLDQRLIYATADDYMNYNAEEMPKRGGDHVYTGTLDVVDSSILTTTYVDVKGKEVKVADLCTKDDAATYRYIALNFEAIIYGDGYVVAYSNGGTYESEGNCVKVPGNGQEVVVIYKSEGK